MGVSIAPADENGMDGRSRYSYKVEPGQMIADHVRVSNPGSTPITITLQAADAFNAEDGAYSLMESSVEPEDAGSWVTFEGNSTNVAVPLEPAEALIVAFEVRVQADATPGDHAGGIVASAAVVGEGQLVMERRVATRMYVRVAGELQPALTLSSYSATYESGISPAGGKVQVTAVVVNTGNVALSGTVALRGSTWFGIAIGEPIQAELLEMLPGSTRKVSYELANVPQVGFVKSRLQLRSAIEGDALDPGPLPVVERQAIVPAIPWLVLVIVVVGGGGGWLLLRRRRRRDVERAKAWIAHTQAEAGRSANADPGSASTALPGSPDADEAERLVGEAQ